MDGVGGLVLQGWHHIPRMSGSPSQISALCFLAVGISEFGRRPLTSEYVVNSVPWRPHRVVVSLTFGTVQCARSAHGPIACCGSSAPRGADGFIYALQSRQGPQPHMAGIMENSVVGSHGNCKNSPASPPGSWRFIEVCYCGGPPRNRRRSNLL